MRNLFLLFKLGLVHARLISEFNQPLAERRKSNPKISCNFPLWQAARLNCANHLSLKIIIKSLCHVILLCLAIK